MDDIQQSEWNIAGGYLNRINVILWECNEASKNLDAVTWYHALFNLWKEVNTYMKDTEQTKLKTKFYNNLAPQIFANIKQKMDMKLYVELSTIELELRDVLNKTGMLNKMKEDAGMALK